jgi:hypothetical protein
MVEFGTNTAAGHSKVPNSKVNLWWVPFFELKHHLRFVLREGCVH